MKNRTRKVSHNILNYSFNGIMIFSSALGPIWNLKHVYLYHYLEVIYDK